MTPKMRFFRVIKVSDIKNMIIFVKIIITTTHYNL